MKRIAPLTDATEDAIAFIAHPRYRAALADSRAGVVIAPPDLVDDVLARPAAPPGGWACWESPDPYLTFAHLTQWWRRHVQPRPRMNGIHPTAYIDPSARVAPSAAVGPFAIIEAGAVLEADAEVGAHAVVQA
ncbi:MAG: LpxD N-terminal domain-containing protein, partial [Tepidimonas sp.]|uniref:LpxD N-terminal domain-containing protein n=1 Tax=Tepidimonas sp. TaxID=2002775 RepID=UPI004055286F